MRTFFQLRGIIARTHGDRLLSVLYAVVALLITEPIALAGNRTVVDDLGFKIAVKENIRRVVSLVPTNSEMVCLLDCRRLIGGTRYDEFPAELKKRVQSHQIETIGGGFDANLERIVQLQPDLILTNGPTQQRFAVPLKNLGYSVLSIWPRDMAGLTKDFLLLGELLAQGKKARAAIDDLQSRFLQIRAKAEKQPKKKVYLQVWTDPLITIGKLSFPDWMVAAAGGINIFSDLPFDSAQVSLESLIRRDPEVLIFLADQEPFAKTLRTRPGWSSIRGVRDAHFCFIEESDIRRSIQFIDGLVKLQECLLDEKRLMGTISTETK
jgi:ABC-type Fe3+-hydroxamate transport system substrate-binding protein